MHIPYFQEGGVRYESFVAFPRCVSRQFAHRFNTPTGHRAVVRRAVVRLQPKRPEGLTIRGLVIEASVGQV